jgi:hypothetical protein
MLKCNISMDVNHLHQGLLLGLTEDREKNSTVLGRLALFKGTCEGERVACGCACSGRIMALVARGSEHLAAAAWRGAELRNGCGACSYTPVCVTGCSLCLL